MDFTTAFLSLVCVGFIVFCALILLGICMKSNSINQAQERYEREHSNGIPRSIRR